MGVGSIVEQSRAPMFIYYCIEEGNEEEWEL